MKLLIIGGAGYIGSHFLRSVNFKDKSIVVLDDLSTGRESRIPEGVSFVKGNACDGNLLEKVIDEHQIENVIHLAARRQARESIKGPLEYWVNNVGATLSLVSSAKQTSIKNILFASSCSVYGNANQVSVDSKVDPVSPYGRTKAVCEQILRDSCQEMGIGLGILRFFNVIGAASDFDSADTTKDALMPNLVEAVVLKKPFEIYGNNFTTRDGTALRDYLDVRDLVSAHGYILNNLIHNGGELIVNVSNGSPTTVLEIVNSAVKHLGVEVPLKSIPSQAGDPGEIFAEKDRFLANLGWTSEHTLDESVAASIESYRRFLREMSTKES